MREQQAAGWRAIETAPRDGTWLLVCRPGDMCPYLACWSSWADGRQGWVGAHHDPIIEPPGEEPTLWQLAPEPPQMAERQTALRPIEAFNDSSAESRARAADPRFDRAMNAFWRSFHREGRDLQRCVAAALKAADGGSEPTPELITIAEWHT